MKVALSFQEISRAVRRLTVPPVDLVVGIGRGGIVPASLIAYHLRSDLITARLTYRDDDNRPLHDAPVLRSLDAIPDGVRTVLLVDDVSVTGKTLEAARQHLDGYTITTLVLKGHADIVLFPEIRTCVQWPWHPDALERT